MWWSKPRSLQLPRDPSSNPEEVLSPQILQFPQPSSPRGYLEPAAPLVLHLVKERPRGAGRDRALPLPWCVHRILEWFGSAGTFKIIFNSVISFLKKSIQGLTCSPSPVSAVHPSQEPGWLEGTLNGKTGLIPENYVEFL